MSITKNQFLLSLFLCAFILSFSLPRLALGNTTLLPKEIESFLLDIDDANFEILSTAEVVEPGKGDGFFVLTADTENENSLYHFVRQAGGWVYDYHTKKAIPQGGKSVGMYMSDGGEDWGNGQFYEGPLLVLTKQDYEKEYTISYASYQLNPTGNWMLKRVWRYEENISMEIHDGFIVFYREVESGQVAGIARGLILRDLRFCDLDSIPKSLFEAKAIMGSNPKARNMNHVFNLADYRLSSDQALYEGVLTFFSNGEFDLYIRFDPESPIDSSTISAIAVYSEKGGSPICTLEEPKDGLFVFEGRFPEGTRSILLIPINTDGSEQKEYSIRVP